MQLIINVINKGVCNKEFIWNFSNCECKSDKLFDIGECLDYSSCKWRKKVVDKLVEECTENIDVVEITHDEIKCSSCTL